MIFALVMGALADARIPVAWVKPGNPEPERTALVRDTDGFCIDSNGLDPLAIILALRSRGLEVLVK